MEILKQFLDLNIAIQKEFNPLNWVDITNYENGTGSISFTDDGESEDVFFNKMYKKFLYSYFKNLPDTEDAMQTVYLKVKMNISSYTVGTNGRAWLFQIAKNHALSEIKKNSRKFEAKEEVQDTDFLRGEITDAMQRALTGEEQRIIILHVLWGYKHREIGKILDCPTGTVTSKYKRAIEKMRKALKEGV